jgi:hypothetical protein
LVRGGYVSQLQTSELRWNQNNRQGMQMHEGTSYNTDHPSPRYQQLIQAYRHMHEQGSPEQGIAAAAMFPGQSLGEHVLSIWSMVQKFNCRTLLDYGCGKAMLYQRNNQIQLPDGRKASNLQELLGVDATLYDPGVRRYSEKPAGRFDIVVCTDVLEHCGEDDLPWIVGELFDYAQHCLFANVACYPARKHLPNGENAHCTVKPVDWWQALFNRISSRYPQITWQVACTVRNGTTQEHVTFCSAPVA